MTKHKTFRNYIPIVLVVISILFYATPSPWGVMSYLFPLSNLLVLSCWLWLRPKLLSPFTVFFLGLFANLYSPYPLGSEALIWLLVYLSFELVKSILPEPGFIITWVWWFVIVLIRTAIMMLFSYVHYGVLILDSRLLYDIIFATLNFPLYFIILLFVDYHLLSKYD